MTLVRNRMTSFLLQNTIEDTLKNVDNWTSLTQNHISETFLKISIALQRTMNHTQILNTTRLSKWQNVYFWMNWIKHNRYQKSSPFNDLVTTSVRSRKKAGQVYSENLPLSIRWGFNRCLFTASSLLRTISQTYRHRRKTMSKYAEDYSVFETKSPKQCERKQRAHPPPRPIPETQSLMENTDGSPFSSPVAHPSPCGPGSDEPQCAVDTQRCPVDTCQTWLSI